MAANYPALSMHFSGQTSAPDSKNMPCNYNNRIVQHNKDKKLRRIKHSAHDYVDLSYYIPKSDNVNRRTISKY